MDRDMTGTTSNLLLLSDRVLLMIFEDMSEEFYAYHYSADAYTISVSP